MSSGTGIYFDGETLRGHHVTLELSDDRLQLKIRGETVQEQVPSAGVQISEQLGSVPRFLYLPNGATVETADHLLAHEIGRCFKRRRLGEFIYYLEAHQRFAAISCVLVVALFGLLIYHGPPTLARAIARRVPPTIEAQAGRAALAALSPYLGASYLTEPERRTVRRALDRLLPHRSAEGTPRLEFRSFGEGFPNAIALPGGIIIVADELVRLASDHDEIAAVLAHELAHVDRRHGMQAVLRNSTALLIVTTLTGDLATLSSFAATAPFLILNRGYSRDLEREADASARELLQVCGIDPKKFSSLLLKLEAAGPSVKGSVAYFSTHPRTEDRVRDFAPLPPEEQAAILAEANSDAKPLIQSAPAYPRQMEIAQISGEVVVEFVINAQGNVENARAIRATRREFEAPAIAAVSQWKFLPARKHFRSVPATMHVPIQFKISETTSIAPLKQ